LRLQKYLAQCGVASRRKAEELIRNGRISVNGKVVDTMGYLVDPNRDMVELDFKPVAAEDKKVYILLNKPSGVISSAKDERGRRTVLDLVDVTQRLYPVGRLDFMTEGLIILTNDGDFSYLMTHPKHEIPKRYRAYVKGFVTDEEADILQKGVVIDGYATAPAKVGFLNRDKTSTLLDIEIHEGRNRQVRKMCDAVGHPVIRLKRISIGFLGLGGLKKGQWRHLTQDEIKKLKEMC